MKVLFFHRNAEWLGIEYLSSALKKAGHATELIFDPGAGDVEYQFKFLDRKPDLIAFSCLTNLYPWVSTMVGLLKDRMDVPIIVGGLHPTILPDFVIANPHIDMICVGEGEEALVELADSIGNGKINYEIRNIWFKKDGRIVKNASRPLIQDMDALPFPDKDLFRKYGCFSSRIYVMTGRGCPFHCTYCFNSFYREKFSGNGYSYVRRRSVENVMRELEHFKAKYRLSEVFFYDDIFSINDAWIKVFCAEYKKRIKLPFKVLVHPQTVKEETMTALADAGCIYVDIGLESGNEDLRRALLKRNMSNDDIVRTGKILKKVGIKFCTLNILGFPGETKAQMWDTYKLNEALHPDGAIVSIFYPFPKTELAEFSLKNGFLNDSDYQKICQGKGGYKSGSLLNNVEIAEALKLQILIPVMVKMPRFLRPLLTKIPVNSFTRIFSIFFLSIPRNAYIRIKESIIMFIKSHLAYIMTKK